MSWQQQPYNPNYQPPRSQGQWRPPQQSGPPPPTSYNPNAPPSGYGYQQQQGPPGYNAGPPASYGGGGPPASYRGGPPASYSGGPPASYSVGGGAPPGGYGGGPPRGYGGPASGPPPGMDPDLYAWFQAVDSDRSGKITAVELQQALLNNNWSHFNSETCRLLIGMFDSNSDGSIDIHEFAALWKYVQEWKSCFDRFDKDGSGNIDAYELQQALQSFGYRLSMDFCQLCTRLFDRNDKRTMKFDDFIQCCVMLKSLTESFRKADTSRSGVITVSYEQFLEMAIDNTM